MHYNVLINEIHTITLNVEANSKEEALEKAEALLLEADDLESVYSWTQEKDEWKVSPA